MARNPGRDNDLMRLIIRLREEIRQLRIRPRAHTTDRTCLVGGDITVGMYIPPLNIAVNPDGDNAPEWKYAYSLSGKLRAGTCTLEWLLNGSLIATQDLSTSALTGRVVLDPNVELAQGDELQITVTDAASASDMNASVHIITSPS